MPTKACKNSFPFRIGYGYDVHCLAKGRKLILGGIEIPHTKGCLGHSDADVLIHAICDALLGACSLGDIGKHFPDTNVKYKGIKSGILLEEVTSLIRSKGFEIGNIDTTLAMQQPKIAPYIPKMIAYLSTTMGISCEQISVKATTTEKLGFEGREEGVSAHAVVLLYISE